MGSTRSAASFCQTSAYLVLALSLVAAGLHVWHTVREEGAYAILIVAGAAPAVAYLMIGAGLGAALMGIAASILKRTDSSRGIASSLDAMNDSIGEVQSTLTSIQSIPDPAEAAPRETSASHDVLVSAGASRVSGDVDLARSLTRMIELLDDIREVSLMNESQRQSRLVLLLDRRRVQAIERIHVFLAENRWREGGELLVAVERQFPGEVSVIRIRSEFDQKRSDAERASIAETRQKIDGMIAVSSWDEALAEMNAFIKRFPESVEGQLLLDRVAREQALFVDSTTQRLYDEVKSESERRNWRRALATAKRLVDKFPNHPTTQRLADQLETLRENADVQERKEVEQQIQQLIRSKRYEEVIPIAENFVARWPDAKQSATISELLPKLREKVDGPSSEPVVTE